MKCGSCKGSHTTAAAVKECYRRIPNERPSERAMRIATREEDWNGPSAEEITTAVNQFQEELTENSDAIAEVLFGGEPTNTRSTVPDHLTKRHPTKKDAVAVTDFETPNLMGEHVMNGRFAVVMDGEQITLRFHVPTMGKWKGTQLVEYLYGPDNTMSGDWMRFGNAVEGGYRVWARYVGNTRLLDAVRFMMTGDKEALVKAGEAYAMASTNCWRCGRDLTREKSIRRGLGPICADKVGV